MRALPRRPLVSDRVRAPTAPQQSDVDVTRLLEGQKGVILGVANKRSIAWSCAKSLTEHGMRLAFTYPNERMQKSVAALAAECEGSIVLPCDVTVPEQIDEAFDAIGNEFGTLDTVMHSVAFAKREELEGNFFNTSKEGYQIAHEISAYSLTAVARRALPLMEENGGSIMTLTYIGSERVVENYNVMGIAKAALEASVRYLAHDLGPHGIRVNAISAGPIRTLSASGISGFNQILDHIASRAPLRRNITADEVGDVAAFLASKLSRGVTGTTMYVDGGYHIMGV